MKIVTAVTAFNDAVGTRLSIVYSEIDETSGKVVSDNKRIDRIVTDSALLSLCSDLKSAAQSFVDLAN